MRIRPWESLPASLQVEAVRPYYEALRRRTGSLVFKRVFDAVVSFVCLLLFSPILLLIALAVKLTSPGPVFFRQARVTQYGRVFRIFKFRTMVADAERLGAQVTTDGDTRVTGIGRFLRKVRLDELPQLLNILIGDMTFVGTRPEVVRYVEQYTPEMRATLLLPAGVTSEASIAYKDEARLLADAADADRVYVDEVLPAKMRYNLAYLLQFSFWNDMKLMARTVWAVLH